MSIKLTGYRAIVVMSGGQDSTICLHLALKEYDRVYAIAFDYGQTHRIELDCARTICRRYDVPLTVVRAPIGELTPNTALTGARGSTFVPARNLIFLTLAAAHAASLGVKTIVGGVCQSDHAHYPDCRKSTIESLAITINLGLGLHCDDGLFIEAPLMGMTKADIFNLGHELGVQHEILTDTHTCYAGDREKWNDWGYGCGKCSACLARAAGWVAYNEGVNNGK